MQPDEAVDDAAASQSKNDAANKDAGDAGNFSYSWSLIASIGRLVLF